MHASVGDIIHTHSSHTGLPEKYCRIIGIRGLDGTPPYLVEYPDGHQGLVFPGPDAVIESSELASARGTSWPGGTS